MSALRLSRYGRGTDPDPEDNLTIKTTLTVDKIIKKLNLLNLESPALVYPADLAYLSEEDPCQEFRDNRKELFRTIKRKIADLYDDRENAKPVLRFFEKISHLMVISCDQDYYVKWLSIDPREAQTVLGEVQDSRSTLVESLEADEKSTQEILPLLAELYGDFY